MVPNFSGEEGIATTEMQAVWLLLGCRIMKEVNL